MKTNCAALFCGASIKAFLLGCSPVARAQAQAQVPVQNAAQPSPLVPLVVIPFVLEHDLIFLTLPMTQAGPGDTFRVPKTTPPFRIVLDSGADFSALAIEAFTERKITVPSKKPGEKDVSVQGQGNGGSVSAHFISGVEFDAGGISLKDEPVVASMKMLHEIGVDGVLGAQLFRHCVVEVNYAARTVGLFPPDTFTAPTSGSGFVAVPLQFIPNSNRAIVSVEVTPFGFGQTTARLEVDTGKSGTVTFAAPFVKQNYWESFLTNTVEMQSTGFNGINSARRSRLESLQFGGVMMTTPYADFSFDTKGSMAKTETDGLLGGAILSRFTLIFDYAHAVMYVRPNADAHAPFPFHL